jgi:hypothetical protein
MKITAEEARQLSGLSIEEKVDVVFELIRKTATLKERNIKLNHDNLWKTGGYSRSPDWLKACRILKDVGFTVDYYFSEDQTSVSYTIVSW